MVTLKIEPHYSCHKILYNAKTIKILLFKINPTRTGVPKQRALGYILYIPGYLSEKGICAETFRLFLNIGQDQFETKYLSNRSLR